MAHQWDSLASGDVFALLENGRAAPHQKDSLLFVDPIEEIACREGERLDSALDEVERRRAQGAYVCGYVAYEAGYFLAAKPAFTFRHCAGLLDPLLRFFVFRNAWRLCGEEIEGLFERLNPNQAPTAVHGFRPNLARTDYLATLNRIRDYLLSGDTYQVNFAFKTRFAFEGGAIALYRALRPRQRVEFGGLLNFPDQAILSLSPELFVDKCGEELLSKPMKGTARRGRDAAEDEAIVESLKSDPKSVAENMIVVDLIRNDIGQLSQIGSVEAAGLLEAQTFETVHQLVSTVRGRVARGLTLGDAFHALFPCGSITGAPKLRTMQIIEELEAEPRGVYTGAIGYAGPQDDFRFNVAIRTCVARDDGSAEIGVGSGVVYGADAQAEYEECRLKLAFLEQANGGFHLIETMAWEGALGAPLLPRHLARLERSAAVFGFAFDRREIEAAFAAAAATLGEARKRIRLLLKSSDAPTVEIHELGPPPQGPLLVRLSGKRTDERSVFLRHKTSERRLYEREYSKAAAEGFHDVVFQNSRGEATEASRHNLFVEARGRFLTSPADCGLLEGVQRQLLIEKLGRRCEVRPVSLDDLLAADRIFLTNAVRGVAEARLVRGDS